MLETIIMLQTIKETFDVVFETDRERVNEYAAGLDRAGRRALARYIASRWEEWGEQVPPEEPRAPEA